MMQLFSLFFGGYLSAAKAYILLAVAAAVLGYVGYLNWQLSSARTELKSMQVVIVECRQQAKELTTTAEQQRSDLERIQEYYRNKKCLNLKDGILTEEDMQW